MDTVVLMPQGTTRQLLPKCTLLKMEGVLNREIGIFLRYFLGWESLNVVCTVAPDNPCDLPLKKRVKIANSYNKKETLFVSIHCNACKNHKGSGFEIYTTKGLTQSDELAERIADNVQVLYDKMHLKLRYDFSDGDKDKEADFYVLRHTKCPAVLIECLFFDNRKEYELLKMMTFQLDVAYAIYLGILEYLYN